MSTLQSIKGINDADKNIVLAYIADIQKLFPKHNVYLTIPELVIHWVLLYFYISDEFDTNNKGKSYSLSQDNSIVTKNQSRDWNLVSLTSKAISGIYIWKFELTKVDKWRYSIAIGIWKTKFEIEIGWEVVNAPLGPHTKDQNEAPSYDKTCRQGDIVEMILDLDKLQLGYKVNDIDYGILFDNIEKTKYVAVLSMFKKNDSIRLLSYRTL